jgi:hypothetical protein
MREQIDVIIEELREARRVKVRPPPPSSHALAPVPTRAR